MTRKLYRKMQRDAQPPSKKPLMGLNRWECSEHGFIVDALKGKDVVAWCPCGRLGKITARGPERSES